MTADIRCQYVNQSEDTMNIDEVLYEGYDKSLTDDQWLSTAEVVKLLDVSRQTLASFRNKGLVKAYRKGLSNKNMYSKKELTDLITKANTIRSI